MRLTQGTKVTSSRFGDATFQGFTNGRAAIALANGRLELVAVDDLKMNEDSRDNLLREFIEYAAENKVAPTDLVNEALKVVG
jgi:hypothetical protein